MTIPINALTKVYGDSVDDLVAPVFTKSDISGDFGAGLLMDLDFADPDGAGAYAGSWTAGDLIVNSAWEHVVRRLIPTATKNSLSGVVGGAFTSSQIVVQRSGKNYPHVIVSKVGDTTTSRLFITIPADILTYILANPTHQYRAAIEERITRLDTQTSDPGNTESLIHVTATSTANYLYRMEGLNSSTVGFRPTGSKRLLASGVPDLGSTLGERFKSISVDGVTGSLGASLAALQAYAFMWGPSAAGGVHKARSSIARRFTFEDITVSQAVLASAVSAGSGTSESQTAAGCDTRHQSTCWVPRKASTDYYSGDTFNDPDSVLL